MTAQLFTPLDLSGLTLANRIVVSPMCQYSAVEGSAQPWHQQHLGSMALSGAGLVIVEATGVEPEGRITPACLGLYSDANEVALTDVIKGIRTYSPTPIGIQLAHAGRKASTDVPWRGGKSLGAGDGAWTTVGPSALPFAEGWHTPEALDAAGMKRITDAFVATARRALRCGFDLAELHGAHGYLLHQFLSPFSNHRTDDYGGSLENRMRFPLEVARAVREVWPADKPLGIRISASEWLDGGFGIEEAVIFVRHAWAEGLDFVDVSSGGNAAHARIPVGPGYQVPLAERIRQAVDIKVMAVGMIVEAHQAEAVVTEGKADMVAIARGFLDDARWGWHAADALGAEVATAPQYARARPKTWPGAVMTPFGKAA